ncbi:Uroporphyrinogen decarboxylase (URO-D) [Ferroglobus placidus DSM 10642]|uniref:Uroporphyrinogen decarboxylase (URO-D) n=1 Tax=Ferroglobus placidus (strain DSM 10642 / AEDII12DO) TaxID=589924 RepID=D3RZI9_FERPA|nr:uroporphyrinogen decarboxylase family protein [Ferroglobus placidus]ADC65902.1 Uroporphyrinogen decarboxylase (URO-D) [Ferroglobus placidus DSM 10642]
MRPKDILLEAFELGVPERVPAVIFGGGMWTIKNSGKDFLYYIGKPKEYAELIVKTADILQSDMVYPGSGYNNFLAAAIGGKIKVRHIGAPDLEGPIINSPEDLEALEIDKIYENEALQTIWKASEIVYNEIGDKYLVGTTSWGPFTKAGNLRGVEQLMRDIYKNKEFAKKVIEFAKDLIMAFYEPVVKDAGLEAVSIADPTASGDLISRRHFLEFALPPLKELIDEMKKRKIAVFLHICGDTSDKLREIAESKASCFSLDHKVDLGYAKSTLKSVICIAGNVDPVSVLNDGTPEYVEEVSNKCIHIAAEGGGYVLCPGCDIPPTVPLENIQAFIRAARKTKLR